MRLVFSFILLFYISSGSAQTLAEYLDEHNRFFDTNLWCVQAESVEAGLDHPDSTCSLLLDAGGSPDPYVIDTRISELAVVREIEFEGRVRFVFPREVRSLDSLRILWTSTAPIGAGDIPRGMAKCKNLRYIGFLGENALKKLPIGILKLRSLMFLDLDLDKRNYKSMRKSLLKLARLANLREVYIRNSTMTESQRATLEEAYVEYGKRIYFKS